MTTVDPNIPRELPSESKTTEKQMQPEQEEEKAGGILYGRKWLISIFKHAYKDKLDDKGAPVKDKNGHIKQERDTEHDIQIDVSELRCIFRCQYNLNTALSVGTLVVYNLSAATEAEIIKEGFQFSVFGGYEQGQYGEIFTGDIVQVIRNRENGIDYRLEIIAVRSKMDFDWNFVRSSVAAQSTPREVVQAVCKDADKPLEAGKVSEKIPEQALPRGKILFGRPIKYLRDMCIHNNAFIEQNAEGKVEMHTLNDEIPQNMCLELTPESGLIGTPRYTDQGIQIKMLLDARVKLQSLIKINNEIIQKQLISIDPNMQGKNNQQPQQNVFDKDGEYQVLSITHSGDTWSDDWSTEVVGIGRNGRTGLPTAVNTQQQSLQA
jgi:hypothetical protein